MSYMYKERLLTLLIHYNPITVVTTIYNKNAQKIITQFNTVCYVIQYFDAFLCVRMCGMPHQFNGHDCSVMLCMVCFVVINSSICGVRL